jgi:hypothetical protein
MCLCDFFDNRSKTKLIIRRAPRMYRFACKVRMMRIDRTDWDTRKLFTDDQQDAASPYDLLLIRLVGLFIHGGRDPPRPEITQTLSTYLASNALNTNTAFSQINMPISGLLSCDSAATRNRSWNPLSHPPSGAPIALQRKKKT